MSDLSLFDEYHRYLGSYNHTKVEIFYEESEEKIEGKYLLSESECPDMVMHLKVLNTREHEVSFYRPVERKALFQLKREYPSLSFEVYNREYGFSSVTVEGEEEDLDYFFESLDIENVEIPAFGKSLSYINIVVV